MEASRKRRCPSCQSLFIMGKNQEVSIHAQAQIQGTVDLLLFSITVLQLELVCINVRASAEMKGFTYLPTAHPGKSLLCKLLKRPMFLGSLITFLESRLPLLSLLDLSHPSFWLIYKCCQPDDSNEPGSPWKDTVHPYCSHNPLVLLVSWLS